VIYETCFRRLSKIRHESPNLANDSSGVDKIGEHQLFERAFSAVSPTKGHIKFGRSGSKWGIGFASLVRV
jgi:hypothetical protein